MPSSRILHVDLYAPGDGHPHENADDHLHTKRDSDTPTANGESAHRGRGDRRSRDIYIDTASPFRDSDSGSKQHAYGRDTGADRL